MKRPPILSILCAIVLVASIFYFVGKGVEYFSNPMTTTMVYQAQREELVDLNGYLLRDEETFHTDSDTLSHSQKEGARVGVGQTLAVAYPNSEALITVENIESLELRLEQLEFALNSYLDADAALKLDSTISQSILNLRQSIIGGDYAGGYDEIGALKASVLKRDYSYSDLNEIETEVADVKTQLAAEKGKLSDTQRITAPQTGTYSAVCDGYEDVLTVAFLENITASALEGIRLVESDANVGKLIYGDQWYYVAEITDAQAALLEKRSTVNLRLAKGLSGDVSMAVERITDDEDGRHVLVLSSKKYMAQITLLRHQVGELVLKGFEGLRVPANALRVSEDGVTGVYCIMGVTARFKPVTVVWQGEGYALVKPQNNVSDTRTLRVGDEVIATKGELYDGKVVG